MIRTSACLLTLLLVAGCDLFGPDNSRFVGTWVGRSVEETTVTSTVYQPYAGTEVGVRGIGAIEVRGPIEGSLQYFETFNPTLIQVGDRNGTSALMQSSEGYVSKRTTSNPDDQQFYGLPGIAFVVDGVSLTVPETTVPTDDGPLTIGGTLAGRPLELQPGVPTTLPRYRRGGGFESRLVISDDGTYEFGYPSQQSTGRGTWEVRGETLTLTRDDSDADDNDLALVDGELISTGLVDDVVSPRFVETRRGLQNGSLESATSTYLIVYDKED